MAGRAGHCSRVIIQALVIMGGFAVAIGAVDLVGVIHTHRNRAPLYLMVFCLVAGDTLKVQFAHMNVNTFGGEVEAFVHIAMFNGVAAAAFEVARAAVLAGGGGYALRGGCQVNPFGGQPGF